MNWDNKEIEKNKQTLEQNKNMFYNRLFDVDGKTNGYLEWLSILHMILMKH
jgi:hypothetical protein